ncbi:MAG: hypothetical protein ACK5XN_03925, partial [Bacteroidota bacterium]
MSKEIRLFGLAGLCLLVFGGVLMYISGEVTPDVLNRQPVPTATRVVKAIVVTQTRVPVDNFEGVWSCSDKNNLIVTIDKNGNFYDVELGDGTPLLVGTRNGEE